MKQNNEGTKQEIRSKEKKRTKVDQGLDVFILIEEVHVYFYIKNDGPFPAAVLRILFYQRQKVHPDYHTRPML